MDGCDSDVGSDSDGSETDEDDDDDLWLDEGVDSDAPAQPPKPKASKKAKKVFTPVDKVRSSPCHRDHSLHLSRRLIKSPSISSAQKSGARRPGASFAAKSQGSFDILYSFVVCKLGGILYLRSWNAHSC